MGEVIKKEGKKRYLFFSNFIKEGVQQRWGQGPRVCVCVLSFLFFVCSHSVFEIIAEDFFFF